MEAKGGYMLAFQIDRDVVMASIDEVSLESSECLLFEQIWQSQLEAVTASPRQEITQKGAPASYETLCSMVRIHLVEKRQLRHGEQAQQKGGR